VNRHLHGPAYATQVQDAENLSANCMHAHVTSLGILCANQAYLGDGSQALLPKTVPDFDA